LKNRATQQRLRKLGWNRRVLTFDDFEQACERDRITLIVRPLPNDLGQYHLEQSGEVITLSCELRDPLRTLVAFHEYGHALFHVPGHFGLHSKTELEADIIAVVALLPRPLLFRLSPGEISETWDYPLSLVSQRWEFWQKFRV
jgi:Zn-dependent peptidase ImmA (M78 family)